MKHNHTFWAVLAVLGGTVNAVLYMRIGCRAVGAMFLFLSLLIALVEAYEKGYDNGMDEAQEALETARDVIKAMNQKFQIQKKKEEATPDTCPKCGSNRFQELPEHRMCACCGFVWRKKKGGDHADRQDDPVQ